jgi:hypothetical protein
MAVRRRDVLLLGVTTVTFAITLAVLFTLRPLAQKDRLAQKERLAFELGYYVRVCLQPLLSADNRLLGADMHRLSQVLNVDGGPPGDSCLDAKLMSAVPPSLSPQLLGSLLMGTYAADLELARQLRGNFAASEISSEIYDLASRLHPGAQAAVTQFREGQINATELHRRVYNPAELLRYQVDFAAPRRLFALGYYLMACSAADVNALASRVVALADALPIPAELLRAMPRASGKMCLHPPPLSDYFGAWVSGFFRLGRMVAVHEGLRRDNEHLAVEKLNPKLIEVSSQLDAVRASASTNDPIKVQFRVARFAQGRINAGELYQRLFGQEEPLAADVP